MQIGKTTRIVRERQLSSNVARAALLLVLMAGVELAGMVPELRINVWSIRALREVVRNGVETAQLPPAPDGNPRAALVIGRAALARGESAQAVEMLSRALRRAPNDVLLREWLGRAYESQGDLQKALIEWQGVRSWQEMLDAAERAVSAQHWDDAIALLDVVQAALPQETIGYRAQALVGRNERGKAIDLLGESLARWPQSGFRQRWLLAQGNYLGQEKRWIEAATAYRQASDAIGGEDSWLALVDLGRALYYGGQGIEMALAQIEQGIKLKPQRADGYSAVSEILGAEKRYIEAEEWYRQAAEKDPNSPRIVERRVDNLLVIDRVSEAQCVLSEASARFPAEARLYYQLGQVFGRLGDLEQGIANAQRSVSLDRTGNVGYRLALATLLERAGRTVEVIAAYRDALALNDRDAGVHVALGKALNKAQPGDQAAVAEFRRAVEVEPHNPAGYIELGRIYQTQARYAEAESWYKQATERSPKAPWPWVMRSENALLGGNPRLAVDVAEQATRQFPSFAAGYVALAEAYQQAGDLTRAVVAIEKSLQLGPEEHPRYWVIAGQIYESVQQRDKAITAYQRAVAMDSGNRAAQNALTRLRQRQ
ncbi:MAG: tetratricopeptide repeat protein [Chloroflexota bacterium]|nr:MAG: tetratricopeptide repeat protein [Chloroflexota bacterium]